jgi:hypothetical protein
MMIDGSLFDWPFLLGQHEKIFLFTESFHMLE